MKEKISNKNPLKKAIGQFEELSKSPLDYLKEQRKYAEKGKSLVKTLFDNAQASGVHFASSSVPDELFIANMDEEQIWQQLELQNDAFWTKCLNETCRLLSLNEQKLTLNIHSANEDEENGNFSENEDENLSLSSSTASSQQELNDDNDDNLESGSESDKNDSDDDDSAEEKLEIDENAIEEKKSKNCKRSVVDDQFFNLTEMEAFLENEDKKELDKLSGKRTNGVDSDSEEEIDYFEDVPESDEEEDAAQKMHFADFFDTENKQPVVESIEERRQRRRDERDSKNKRVDKRMKEDLGMDDSQSEAYDSDDDDENQPLFPGENDGEDVGQSEDDEVAEEDDGPALPKSDFEMRQSRLQRRIEELENDALEPKSWQLKGEINSTSRPKNSLLEEILEFDSTVRPAPLITEETTLRLEDIIKRRIKSKAWDDVERKIKPINDVEDFRKTLVLNQEKSKESLAQIYEREYLEKLNKMNNLDVDALKHDEPPAHKEIRTAMKSLFLKLDALSNFHYTAKPVAIEAKIITNIPAINMEEVAPLAVSDANLLAPEEVKVRPKGDVIGRTERTMSDKKRERRQKKLKQKLKHKANDKKIEEKEKLGIKVTSKERQTQLMKQVTKSRNVIKTKNTSNDEKALKSSKAFFTQLQDNVNSSSTSNKSRLKNKKKSTTDLSRQEGYAKRLKL